MPDRKPLARPANIIYTYDGSFDGFLCCVFESVYEAQLPYDIVPAGEQPATLLALRRISTDPLRAERVRASIPAKISRRALELAARVFCSCLPHKELRLLEFLLQGYREGGQLCFKLGDPLLAPLLAAERHLLHEAHLLKGFVRFADVGGALVAEISPKNRVLPLIAQHFILRYDQEQFMIFDKTHGAALVYQQRQAQILQVDQVAFPEIPENEARYQALWQRFYQTVAIQGRENPRCRMSQMPKRYWEHLPEVRDLVQPTGNQAKADRSR